MASFASVDDYLRQRDALMKEDRSLRREYMTAQLRSSLEVKADEIVRNIRAKEAATIWKEDHPEVLHPFPGMEFLTGACKSARVRVCNPYIANAVEAGKNIIEKTQIFGILSKVTRSDFKIRGRLTPDVIYRCPRAPFFTPTSMLPSMPPFSSSSR